MSLLTIIRISSYVYLFTSIMIPIQIVDLTSHYLSLVIIQHIDSSNIIPHISKCILLSVRFVVLFTILGGNAIYSLVNQVIEKGKKKGPKNVIVHDKKPAASVSKPLHSSADLMLKTKDSNNKAEPTTAIPIINESNNDINSKNVSIEPITKNSAQTSSKSLDKAIEETAITTKEEEPVAVLNNNDITKNDQLNKDIHEANVKSQELIHNDVVKPLEHGTKQSDNTEPTIPLLSIAKSGDKLIPSGNSSVVNPTLVQDQLTKDSNLPTAATTTITSEHVIPNDTKKEQGNNNNIQPEKKAEAIVPSFNKSDEEYVDEDGQISTTTTSTTVTPPAERTMSVDSKEEYYNNIIKKDSDIKSFSESVRNIFDGPPTTPLPQQTQKSESILIPLPIDSEYHNETNSTKPIVLSQGSIEETMSTATPALTPHAGSTSSRRSSSASNNTSKSRIQSALHKLSSPRPAPQPPQQQTMEPIEMNTSTSKSKSRFSSIRLTRKKSSGSVLNQVEQSKVLQPSPPVDIDVKPTKSSRLNNKLKKTSKRLSKLFT